MSVLASIFDQRSMQELSSRYQFDTHVPQRASRAEMLDLKIKDKLLSHSEK